MPATQPLYLAGDLGATHARLGLASVSDGKVVVHRAVRWPAADFRQFGDAVERFLAERPLADTRIRRACFGVAGPIERGRAHLTNRDWDIDAAGIEAEHVHAPVMLVNDLAAAAAGIDALDPRDLVALQDGRAEPQGTRLIIGAGTGLGIAHAVWHDTGHRVLPSEGGHAGFAPQTPRQWLLAEALRASLGRVEAEHVVSGAGLERIYDALRSAGTHAETPALRDALARGAGAGAIGTAGLEGGDSLAAAALDLFVECYGSVAGDHALTSLARGGVFVVGGIATRILPKLVAGTFLRAFNDKGAFGALTETFPVAVVNNDRLGLLGAARLAAGAAS